MSRMHPGKPPSQRTDRFPDWRDRLRSLTRELVSKLRESFEYDDPTIRRHIIAAVRLAIGEEGQPDLYQEPDTISEDGSEIVLATTAHTYRQVIELVNLDRKNPVVAESFMSEVVASLDEEMGLGWRSKVRKATRIMVSTLMKTRKSDAASIRVDLMEAAREALSDRPLEEMMKVVDTPTGPDGLLSKAAVYRMVLDCETQGGKQRSITAENFMDAVVASLDAELSRPPWSN